MLFLLLLPVGILAQTTYYVSSSEGNDSYPGTISQPWKTLTKVNGFTPKSGDQILFKRGDSWEGTITPPASGSSGSPIVYGAYGSGDKPKIYGSKVITGWTQHSGNIYKANFATTITQLFVDGVKMTLARYPNSGYFNITSVQSSTQLTSTDLSSGINYTGATLACRTFAYWLNSTTVTGSSGQTVTLSSSPNGGIGVDEGFILTNKLEFLDQPGEWYYNSSTNTVYLWLPDGGSPSNFTVRGAVQPNGVYMNNKSYINIENLNILHQKESGILMPGCSHITIDNNEIAYVDYHGIEIPDSNSGSNNTITNNTVTRATRDGIVSFSSNTTISDNVISNIGLLEDIGTTVAYPGKGIYSWGDDVDILYNRITNVGYNGIYFYGENNMVKYNYINGACLVLDDGAGIYTYGIDNYSGNNSVGSEIMYNIVLNVHGNSEGYKFNYPSGSGIYLDDGIRDVTISHNIVHSCSWGVFLHYGGNITVENNQVSDCLIGLVSQGQYAASYYENNIVYAYNRNGNTLWWQNDNQRLAALDAASSVFDYNTYVDHYEDDPIFGDNDSFSEWKARGRDLHSTCDQTSLKSGETEKLFYNDTKQDKTFDLGSNVYRDIDGNTVTGKLTLKPFTGKILIGTTFDKIGSDNQSPAIQNQTFEIREEKTIDELIGKVLASDPDPGQMLTYTISSGNEAGLFFLNFSTGEISAKTTIPVTSDKTIVLGVKVTDDAANPLSSSANITISIKAAVSTVDTTSPAISSFSIPSTSSSLTVPVSSFSATDDKAVAGYLLTESSAAPQSGDAAWVSSAPSSYTFSQDGVRTLYAWVKDAAGNISVSKSASVTITLPGLSPTFSEYLFDEATGVSVLDSQNGNDGTIMNNVYRTAGIMDNGLEFTGAGYVSLGQVFGDNVQSELTLCAWINPTSLVSGYQGIIMHGGPNIDTYALYIRPDLKQVAFKTSGTTYSWLTVDNVAALWDGGWHQLSVTYDGSRKIIYLDGEVLTSVAATGALDSGQGYNLLVGAGRDEATPTLLYAGLMDEVRIYNTALSAAEVSELYHLMAQSVVPSENQSPAIQNQVFSVKEVKMAGDLIGQVIATDPDAGQSLTYSIKQGNAANLFSINSVTGEISANAILQFETDQSFLLVVEVTDNASSPLSASANVTINVSGVSINKAPVITDQTFEVRKNDNVGDLVGQIVATDPDEGQSLTYAIVQGNTGNLFSINPATGEIIINATITSTGTYIVPMVVEVTDNDANSLSASALVTINVVIAGKPSKGEVTATNPKQVVLYYDETLQATQLKSTSLASDFTVSGNRNVLQVTISGSLIYLDVDRAVEYGEVISVSYLEGASSILDVYGYPIDSFSDLYVSNNVDSSIPSISNQVFLVDQVTAQGTVIGQVFATDPDGLTYSITGGSGTHFFAIDPVTGEIFTTRPISGTDDQSVFLNIEVADKAAIPSAATAMVTINIMIKSELLEGVLYENNRKRIILTFSEPLMAGSIPMPSDFVLNNGKQVEFVSIAGSDVILDVDTEFQHEDDILVAYRKGVTPLLDQAGNEVDSFSGVAVNNNILKNLELDPDRQDAFAFGMQVFPNPSDGRFSLKASNLKSSICEVSMFHISGKQVMSQLLYGSNGDLHEDFDLTYLARGTYIVRLTCDDQTSQQKIVII